MTEFEIIQKAFPKEIQGAINSLLTIFAIETVAVGQEVIHIPSRIYYNPLISLVDSKSTQIEKEILNCIFSRHDDGYIRQKAILNIINSDNYWTIP